MNTSTQQLYDRCKANPYMANDAKFMEALRNWIKDAEADKACLDYLQRKCTGASDSERYLPFTLYWGKGQNKSIREVIGAAIAGGSEG